MHIIERHAAKKQQTNKQLGCRRDGTSSWSAHITAIVENLILDENTVDFYGTTT